MLYLERKKSGPQYDEQHFAIGAWIQPPPWLLLPTCKGTQRCTLNQQSIFAKTSLPSVSDNLFSSSANSYPWDHAPQYFGNSNMGSVKDKTQSLLINPFRGISCLTLELFGFFLCSQVTLLAGLDIGYWSASCSSLTKTRAKRLAPHIHENVKQVKTPYFFSHFFIKAGTESLIMPSNKTFLVTQYFSNCHQIYLLD